MPIVLPSVIESLGSGSALRAIQGTGKSAPSGIDAVLSYNGLAMNNRNWLDSFVVTKIDGLSDASVRDERQNNPQEHGETAFDSFYGGRALALNGYIRAFSLDKLRDMEQALKIAFLPLEEKPLKIQGKTLSSSVQIWCRKNAEIVWSEEQNRDDIFLRSFLIPLRASNPRFLSLEEVLRQEVFGVIDTFAADSITANDYLFIEGSKANMKVESGVLIPTSTAQKSFTRVTEEVFHPNPSVQFDYTPKSSFTSSVTGFYLKYKDASNFIKLTVGTGAAGEVILQKMEGGVPTSLVMTYTKGSKNVSSRILGNTYRVKAEIQGSVVRFYHGTSSEWTTISSYTMSFSENEIWGESLYSRSYVIIRPGSTEWTYDNLSFGVSSMDDEQIMTLVNNGIFESEPIYELIGPIKNPAIHDADTDESLLFKSGTEIPAGDVWKIDIKEGTITNVAGESKFGWLDPLSDWPQLIGGENHLRLSGEGMSPVISGIVPGLVVRYRHSWF